MRVYMDNSATSFPKPKSVVDTMMEYMTCGGTNISRSTSAEANATGNQIFELRESLAEMFGWDSSRNVVFSKNITESLNIVIHGLIQPKDKVLISSLEHNAVTRPLTQVGANIVAIPVTEEGVMDLAFVKRELPLAKALICTHVSNVSGDVMPIAVLSELCRQYKVPFIVDSAQSAGILPLDMKETPMDCLCFTGHKALLGPNGTGGMILSDELSEKIPPFITGGTGSLSYDEIHPQLLPDKYEAGTQNIVGLLGLLAGIQYIKDQGRDKLFQKESLWGQQFYEMLAPLEGIRIIGSKDYANKPPVFSLDFAGKDNAAISYALSADYHIDNRCGLHCAPRAHQTYGTFPQGTVRLSLSHFTSYDDLLYAKKAIQEILQQ